MRLAPPDGKASLAGSAAPGLRPAVGAGQGFADAGAALDYLFSSFSARHSLHRGKRDAAFRRPEVLINLARRLGLLPDPARACLVTGSKGKGTVARLLAWNLQAAGVRAGLVLTPEEVGHLDRIRIDGRPIPGDDFCRLLAALRPWLDEALAAQGEDFYFAPSGLFLLVALAWFREQGVDAWVVEGGRGARFDEIGQLEAAVGVVTNVLPEHLDRLGPAVEDVAADKMSLSGRCRQLVLGDSLRRFGPLLAGRENLRFAGPPGAAGAADRPGWFAELDAIARAAFACLRPGAPWRRFDSPAFFFARGGVEGGRVLPGTLACEAAIHPDCLDADFLSGTGLARGAALLGLSGDKDGGGIHAKLSALGFAPIHTVRLSSRSGHLSAWEGGAAGGAPLAVLDVAGEPPPGLSGRMLDLAERHGSLYVVGVQMFIRSVRRALGVGVLQPGRAQWDASPCRP